MFEGKITGAEPQSTRPKGRHKQCSKDKRCWAKNGERFPTFLSRDDPRSIRRGCCREDREGTRQGIQLRRKRQQAQEDGKGLGDDHETSAKEVTRER